MKLARVANAILLTTLTTILLGCDQSGTRPCDAFGLPLADAWSTRLNVGDTATYMNQTGATKTLMLSSRVDSEPYDGYDRFGAEEVVCNMTSVRRYIFQEDGAALLFTLSQNESFGATIEQQSVWINILVEFPPEPRSGYRFLTRVFDPVNWYPAEFTNDNPRAAIPRDTRHIVNYTNSINEYPLAIEQNYLYLDNIPIQESPVPISRVVLAENGGLVQFETLSGDVYSRIDTEQ